MGTNDLTEMAWDVIVRPARVSDTLKAELGAMAGRFKTEDEWLRGVYAHLVEILEDLPSTSPGSMGGFWGRCDEKTERIGAV